MGRSRGGLTTKIHALFDALGNPLRFLLTGGEVADCTQAFELLRGLEFQSALADKGYDSSKIVDRIEQQGAEAVIPPRSNRKKQRDYDRHLYGERHKIECGFGFMKHYRRIFSRFDKMAERYLSFVHFVGALLWLR